MSVQWNLCIKELEIVLYTEVSCILDLRLNYTVLAKQVSFIKDVSFVNWDVHRGGQVTMCICIYYRKE